MNIDDMKAGRELDGLVAKRLMGYTLGTPPSPESAIKLSGPEYPVVVPAYSTDIAAAWSIYEEKLAANYYIQRYFGPSGVEWLMRDPFDDGMPIASAETVPLLICRSALKVVGVDKEV